MSLDPNILRDIRYLKVKYCLLESKVGSTSSLPTQTGNAGKVLSTNGTTASWITVVGGGTIDTIPTDSSNNAVASNGVYDALQLKANISSLATVATTGSYTDLSNKPSIVEPIPITGTTSGHPMTGYLEIVGANRGFNSTTYAPISGLYAKEKFGNPIITGLVFIDDSELQAQLYRIDTSNGNESSITVEGDRIFINGDYTGHLGIQGSIDFSANYDTLSYVQKGFTDSKYFPFIGGSIKGTAGAGYIGLIPQSSNPTTPTSGVKIYSRSTGAFSWIGTNGFSRTFVGTGLTADRTYTIPDADTTLVGTDNAQTLTNKTITATANTITLGALTPANSTLSFSATYTGATPQTIGLNLANANTWTATQTFQNILPSADNTYALGSSASRFTTIWGTTVSGNSSTLTLNGSSVKLNGNGTTAMTVFNTQNSQFQKGGTFTDVPSALVTINSTTQGFLVPRMTTAQRDAISSPVAGLAVINTDRGAKEEYNGVNWNDFQVSSASTLTLKHAGDYIFTGTTATWTLPAVSSTLLGRRNSIVIKNRGSGAITLNSNAGSTMYTTAAVGTLTINAGEAYTLTPDGTYFNTK